MATEIVAFDNRRHRDRVVRLWEQVFAYKAPHSAPSLVIDSKLAVADGLFFVAVNRCDVVGTIMAGYDGHRGWIYSLAVDPDHRQQGIGSHLLSVAEGHLAVRGCVKINLQIMEGNEQVQSFYEARDYSVEQRVSMGKRLCAGRRTQDAKLTGPYYQINDRLKDVGMSPEQATLKGKTALLAGGRFFRVLKTSVGMAQFTHPCVEDAYCTGETLVVRSRTSSPMIALQAELLAALDVDAFVYLGIAGAIVSSLDIADIVVSTATINETGTGVIYGYGFDCVIPASTNLAERIRALLAEGGLNPKPCTSWATDGPYMETRGKVAKYSSLGAQCVEMEAAGLFAVARQFGKEATAVFVISDRLSGTKWERAFQHDVLTRRIEELSAALARAF